MSSDFDPRILWTRREVVAAGVAGAALAASGVAAQACDLEQGVWGNSDALFIVGPGVDGGAARRMAHLAGARLVTIPERAEIVRFWASHVEPNLRAGAPVLGLTGWADYLVLRGMGAERRLRVRAEAGQEGGDAALAARLKAALDFAPDAAAGRIGWVLA